MTNKVTNLLIDKAISPSLHSTPLFHLPTKQNPIQNTGIPLYFPQILDFFM